ncbi:BMP family ABC transporter substrate-binding protein [Candidatus Poriferisodalis sp.]|uniref:BMP family ABC transporter substrate-binding protein n=1 Tax=Candidatus Poriferisodalis sp. TaxID=3101277 RepID=UPI003B024ECF
MRSRTLTRITAALLGVALLAAACGGDDDTDAAATTEVPAATTEAAEPEPAVEDDEMDVMSTADITAAFVLVGPVGDAGWNWAHDQGRIFAEAQTGARTLFVESVPENSEAFKEVAVDFIENEGADIIFGTSFGYMDPMLELADEYPDVVFEHASGYKMNDTNFGNFFGRIYQPRYLSGMAAGAMTETGQIGYVAAFPIPEVIRGINAFTLGAREVNPSAEVHVNWTFTWFDPAIEGDTASALLEAGADVIAMHQDSPQAGVAAQDAGARWVAYNSDMRDFAPEAFVTAPIWHWGPRYAATIEAVASGTYSPGAYWGGMEDGIVQLAELSADVPGDVTDRIGEFADLIRTGTWDVFTGPINDQDGTERVAAGETMEDGPMLGMDWFVEGVVGDASP